MKPIGTILKNARLSKGLSLEDLHKLTKIRIRHLESIEGNDWNMLPGHTYATGFIKRIADALDLDPEKVHALFRREYKNSEKPMIIPQGMINTPLAPVGIVLTIRKLVAKLFT